MNRADDHASTFDTIHDWLAPEILEQLNKPGKAPRTVRVDLFSNVWSANVAIHYLLFGCSPPSLLTEVSLRSIAEHLRSFHWPAVSHGFQYFRPESHRCTRCTGIT